MLNNKFIYIGKNPAWTILHQVFLTRLQFVLKDTVLENFYLCILHTRTTMNTHKKALVFFSSLYV